LADSSDLTHDQSRDYPKSLFLAHLTILNSLCRLTRMHPNMHTREILSWYLGAKGIQSILAIVYFFWQTRQCHFCRSWKPANVTFPYFFSMLKKAQETVVFPERPTLSVVELLDFHKLRKPKKKQNQRRDLFYELEPVLPL